MIHYYAIGIKRKTDCVARLRSSNKNMLKYIDSDYFISGTKVAADPLSTEVAR